MSSAPPQQQSQSQSPETPLWETPSSKWYTPRTTPWWRTPSSTHQDIVSKPPVSPRTPVVEGIIGLDAEPRKESVILWQPRSSRTNPWIWFGAALCLVFCLVLIFFGIATLIVFHAIGPRTPVFDIPNANLNTIYFDSPMFFNGDLSLLANFTNPNKKIGVRFESLEIKLFFYNRLIARQGVQPFSQRRGATRLEAVHLISSSVYLPLKLELIWG